MAIQAGAVRAGLDAGESAGVLIVSAVLE